MLRPIRACEEILMQKREQKKQFKPSPVTSQPFSKRPQ